MNLIKIVLSLFRLEQMAFFFNLGLVINQVGTGDQSYLKNRYDW